MKRMVTADDRNRDLLDQRIVEDVGNILYHAGYSVRSTGSGDSLKLIITPFKDEDKMPKIDVQVKQDDEYMCLLPTLTFPKLTIDWDDGYDFYDSIEHWLDKWSEIGTYITEINKYALNIEDFWYSVYEEQE